MNRSFAAWLTIMSIATVVKFISMISATGRMPTIAAPIAAPMIACSEIGVVRTRDLPYLVDRPRVTPTTPPSSSSPMSSPSRMTFWSSAMASSSALLTAWMVFIGLAAGATALMRSTPRQRRHGAIPQRRVRRSTVRIRRPRRAACSMADFERCELGFGRVAVRDQPGAEGRHRIAAPSTHPSRPCPCSHPCRQRRGRGSGTSSPRSASGPPPARARSMASFAAAYIASGSLPSTVTPGIW